MMIMTALLKVCYYYTLSFSTISYGVIVLMLIIGISPLRQLVVLFLVILVSDGNNSWVICPC